MLRKAAFSFIQRFFFNDNSFGSVFSCGDFGNVVIIYLNCFFIFKLLQRESFFFYFINIANKLLIFFLYLKNIKC